MAESKHDQTTGETRLLDAADDCRAFQAEVKGWMADIRSDTKDVAAFARTFQPFARIVLTWKGICLCLGLVFGAMMAPSVLSILALLLLLGKADQIATIIR